MVGVMYDPDTDTFTVPAEDMFRIRDGLAAALSFDEENDDEEGVPLDGFFEGLERALLMEQEAYDTVLRITSTAGPDASAPASGTDSTG